MNNYNDNKTVTYFMDLPNELLVKILSYLNITDILQAFNRQNQRLNHLIYDYECVRHVTMTNEMTNSWLDQYMPKLQHNIEIICLNEDFLQCVFADKWIFPKLQLINLQGKLWNMSLIVDNKSASIVLASSLNFLRELGLPTNEFLMHTQNHINDNKIDSSKPFLCPFIKRLLVDAYFSNDLYVMCTRTPNLTHLTISNFVFNWDTFSYSNGDNFIKGPTHLVELNIIRAVLLDFDLLELLIKSCQASLKKLLLNVNLDVPIDGCRLESLFKSCEKLEKLAFLFDFPSLTIDLNGYSSTFESEWWLDVRCPTIYIQCNADHNTIIATMPCQFSFPFINELENWHFNKGDRNSSCIRFTNINMINFTNNVRQSISLEYLYSIDRIFTSPHQILSFDYCHLESVDILFSILMDDTSMTPVLPNVKHFIVGSKSKLDSMMLYVWILLSPNLKRLDISNLKIFDKIELAKGLSDMLDNDERLKPAFDRINQLIILKNSDFVDIETKNEILIAYQKVFTKTKLG